ncbi:MAG TPA: dihydropteroate synthase [Bacteroidales bacterium]|nr:dihydropteroate synthase [Bacteroidales bacterium]HPS16586.1 dihydropteroate synthase [Bacteroidales bacterium]
MNTLHKNTFFSSQKSINCCGKLLILEKPVIMGILNITPDSFYDGGKYSAINNIIEHTKIMIDEGAAIIDIGAVSTKPGAKTVSLSEEKKRLLPVVKLLLKEIPEIIISIDTFRSEIAKAAIEEGACIINDISAGQFDEKMFTTIAKLQVPYIIMHIQGTPENMQVAPHYKNVVQEVLYYFSEKINQLVQLGVNDIIIDPGFGFGKTVEHNYDLLNHLDFFRTLNLPILAGVSRKSMINKVLGTKPESALNGTTVLNTMALMKGANILRVHDVKEAVETVKLFNALKNPIV